MLVARSAALQAAVRLVAAALVGRCAAARADTASPYDFCRLGLGTIDRNGMACRIQLFRSPTVGAAGAAIIAARDACHSTGFWERSGERASLQRLHRIPASYVVLLGLISDCRVRSCHFLWVVLVVLHFTSSVCTRS